MSTQAGTGTRLVGVDELGDTQVTVVKDTPHGDLAVGLADGVPFATSNRCRHFRASLGEGRVTEDGCLECPWHHARFDVRDGRMVVGPGGVFQPISGVVRGTLGRRRLVVHPVELRDGAIFLA